MVIRLIAALLLVSSAGNAVSQEITDDPAIAVGDTVLIDLIDAPALAYLKARSIFVPEGIAEVPGAVGVPLEARVTVASEDKLEVQHLRSINYGTDAPKVFTVTVTGRLADLKKPSGAVTARPATDSVPAAVQRMQKRHALLPSLRIGNLDAVKLQFWVPEQR